jgi:hypothetical protein
MEQSVAPRPAAPSPTASPEVAIDETRMVSRYTGRTEWHEPSRPPTTQILPAPEVHEAAATLPDIQEGRPQLQVPRSAAGPQAATRQDAGLNVTSVRPAREQEQSSIVRASQAAAPTPAISIKNATPEKRSIQVEKRSIQVRIGRVEIRSTQPAPVVRTVRPPSTGGFDDFKLARNYLDRNSR